MCIAKKKHEIKKIYKNANEKKNASSAKPLVDIIDFLIKIYIKKRDAIHIYNTQKKNMYINYKYIKKKNLKIK